MPVKASKMSVRVANVIPSLHILQFVRPSSSSVNPMTAGYRLCKAEPNRRKRKFWTVPEADRARGRGYPLCGFAFAPVSAFLVLELSLDYAL